MAQYKCKFSFKSSKGKTYHGGVKINSSEYTMLSFFEQQKFTKEDEQDNYSRNSDSSSFSTQNFMNDFVIVCFIMSVMFLFGYIAPFIWRKQLSLNHPSQIIMLAASMLWLGIGLGIYIA